MDKQQSIDLTKLIYRLTLLFPKKEPLRYKMREAADDILASFFNMTRFAETSSHLTLHSAPPSSAKDLVTHLEVLDGFFEVAKAQNWVKKEELLEIQQGYDNLRRELQVKQETGQNKNNLNLQNPQPQKVSAEAGPPPIPPQIQLNNSKRTERQERILAFLREQGRAQVWQIKQILPEVTKRTLRRDFEALLKQGQIERIGERNNTFYQIKTA